MSTYQYYEFQALDRPLTEKEQDYIRTLSSRVQLNRTQAIFLYHYGDFRGKPEQVLEKCFDIMLYTANWGSRQLMFRLPKSLINPVELEPYQVPDGIEISTTEQSVIIDIKILDEDLNGWTEGEGLLPRMLSLRDDLLQGDYRVLYLGWLQAAQLCYDFEPDTCIEPPIPANLHNLSKPLQAFVDFIELNQDLIDAAAQLSPLAETKSDSIKELQQRIPQLSEEERNKFLARLLQGELNLNLELSQRLRSLSKKPTPQTLSDSPGRTLSELLTLCVQSEKLRKQKEQQTAKQEKIQKIQELAPRESYLWEQVFHEIGCKQVKAYDRAIVHLLNLQDIAEYQGKLPEFQARVRKIQQDYSNLRGVMSRLRDFKLWQD
ncbi:hypothetical protein [Oscillatoria acuminata]|uniref:Uncharacterized protein n=1 Tax=Oscillatoria acuminata PCC 6304 TaxID=56110 RepID=K9TJT5_9CYAN|nr:hypothetical protein [Oscillatoria acuminata]AFY82416.1 hypothetical protein Oscil6304_2811 [Oscillatoria acuminata PCC 6304]